MALSASVTRLLASLTLLQVAVLTVHWTPLAAGECNVCSAVLGMACVSRVKFAVCANGRPAGQTYDCPAGQVCSTVGNVICQPNTTETVVACRECGICDATHTFACTSTTTFALCLGSDQLSPYTGSCLPDSVCSINYPYICGRSNDPGSGVAATCSVFDDDEPAPTTITTTTTTSTAAPSTTTAAPVTPSVSNPSPYCQIIKQSGRFPVGSNPSTTCRQYVHCFLHCGTWLGASYTCPGYTFFNSSSQLCGREMPARCGDAIQSFSLSDFELL